MTATMSLVLVTEAMVDPAVTYGAGVRDRLVHDAGEWSPEFEAMHLEFRIAGCGAACVLASAGQLLAQPLPLPRAADVEFPEDDYERPQWFWCPTCWFIDKDRTPTIPLS